MTCFRCPVVFVNAQLVITTRLEQSDLFFADACAAIAELLDVCACLQRASCVYPVGRRGFPATLQGFLAGVEQ